MPRSIEVTVPPEKAEEVLNRVQRIDGVVGLARHRGASLKPPGDIITIQTTNDAMRPVYATLTDLRVSENGSILTSAPRSLSCSQQRQVDQESNETIWPEMAFLLRQDTNLAVNYLALMMLAGAVAGVGLWTDTLHIVIGAMVIAPAFEPLVRIPFGLIAGPREVTSRGLLSALAGYAMLALGGAIAVLILQAVDQSRGADLEARHWVGYWSTVQAPGIVVSTFAATAGALVVLGQRSVLTTGVMVALALIPSMSIVGMAAGTGNFSLAGRGLLRWAVDAGLILLLSTVVLGLKQLLLHRYRESDMEQR